MTKYYLLQRDGGFLCGDTDSGVTSYAYPRSAYANRARMAPRIIALLMLDNEVPLEAVCNDAGLRDRTARLNGARMAELIEFGTALSDQEGE